LSAGVIGQFNDPGFQRLAPPTALAVQQVGRISVVPGSSRSVVAIQRLTNDARLFVSTAVTPATAINDDR
jgi:hypothetical protein